MKHLFIALSGHGLGHIGQAAPAVNAIAAALGECRITVQGIAPPNNIHERISAVDTLLPIACDITLLMDGPLHVRREATLAAYQALHAHWDQAVQAQISLLETHRPNIVLCDVPYLPLAAAQTLAIPNLALCSLNWADLLEHYCGHLNGAAKIVEHIRSIYASADAFLRCEPAMPMTGLPNTHAIGPLMSRGQNRRTDLDDLLQTRPGDKLALISVGGMDLKRLPQSWPRREGIHWLAPPAWQGVGDNIHDYTRLPIAYGDLIASVDLLILKPGYGSCTEAAAAGLPCLVFNRADWPEEPYLLDWLRRRCPVETVSAESLLQGNILDAVERLLRQPRGTGESPTGMEQATHYVVERWFDYKPSSP